MKKPALSPLAPPDAAGRLQGGSKPKFVPPKAKAAPPQFVAHYQTSAGGGGLRESPVGRGGDGFGYAKRDFLEPQRAEYGAATVGSASSELFGEFNEDGDEIWSTKQSAIRITKTSPTDRASGDGHPAGGVSLKLPGSPALPPNSEESSARLHPTSAKGAVRRMSTGTTAATTATTTTAVSMATTTTSTTPKVWGARPAPRSGSVSTIHRESNVGQPRKRMSFVEGPQRIVIPPPEHLAEEHRRNSRSATPPRRPSANSERGSIMSRGSVVSRGSVSRGSISRGSLVGRQSSAAFKQSVRRTSGPSIEPDTAFNQATAPAAPNVGKGIRRPSGGVFWNPQDDPLVGLMTDPNNEAWKQAEVQERRRSSLAPRLHTETDPLVGLMTDPNNVAWQGAEVRNRPAGTTTTTTIRKDGYGGADPLVGLMTDPNNVAWQGAEVRNRPAGTTTTTTIRKNGYGGADPLVGLMTDPNNVAWQGAEVRDRLSFSPYNNEASPPSQPGGVRRGSLKSEGGRKVSTDGERLKVQWGGLEQLSAGTAQITRLPLAPPHDSYLLEQQRAGRQISTTKTTATRMTSEAQGDLVRKANAAIAERMLSEGNRPAGRKIISPGVAQDTSLPSSLDSDPLLFTKDFAREQSLNPFAMLAAQDTEDDSVTVFTGNADQQQTISKHPAGAEVWDTRTVTTVASTSGAMSQGTQVRRPSRRKLSTKHNLTKFSNMLAGGGSDGDDCSIGGGGGVSGSREMAGSAGESGETGREKLMETVSGCGGDAAEEAGRVVERPSASSDMAEERKLHDAVSVTRVGNDEEEEVETDLPVPAMSGRQIWSASTSPRGSETERSDYTGFRGDASQGNGDQQQSSRMPLEWLRPKLRPTKWASPEGVNLVEGGASRETCIHVYDSFGVNVVRPKEVEEVVVGGFRRYWSGRHSLTRPASSPLLLASTRHFDEPFFEGHDHDGQQHQQHDSQRGGGFSELVGRQTAAPPLNGYSTNTNSTADHHRNSSLLGPDASSSSWSLPSYHQASTPPPPTYYEEPETVEVIDQGGGHKTTIRRKILHYGTGGLDGIESYPTFGHPSFGGPGGSPMHEPSDLGPSVLRSGTSPAPVTTYQHGTSSGQEGVARTTFVSSQQQQQPVYGGSTATISPSVLSSFSTTQPQVTGNYIPSSYTTTTHAPSYPTTTVLRTSSSLSPSPPITRTLVQQPSYGRQVLASSGVYNTSPVVSTSMANNNTYGTTTYEPTTPIYNTYQTSMTPPPARPAPSYGHSMMPSYASAQPPRVASSVVTEPYTPYEAVGDKPTIREVRAYRSVSPVSKSTAPSVVDVGRVDYVAADGGKRQTPARVGRATEPTRSASRQKSRQVDATEQKGRASSSKRGRSKGPAYTVNGKPVYLDSVHSGGADSAAKAERSVRQYGTATVELVPSGREAPVVTVQSFPQQKDQSANGGSGGGCCWCGGAGALQSPMGAGERSAFLESLPEDVRARVDALGEALNEEELRRQIAVAQEEAARQRAELGERVQDKFEQVRDVIDERAEEVRRSRSAQRTRDVSTGKSRTKRRDRSTTPNATSSSKQKSGTEKTHSGYPAVGYSSQPHYATQYPAAVSYSPYPHAGQPVPVALYGQPIVASRSSGVPSSVGNGGNSAGSAFSFMPAERAGRSSSKRSKSRR